MNKKKKKPTITKLILHRNFLNFILPEIYFSTPYWPKSQQIFTKFLSFFPYSIQEQELTKTNHVGKKHNQLVESNSRNPTRKSNHSLKKIHDQ